MYGFYGTLLRAPNTTVRSVMRFSNLIVVPLWSFSTDVNRERYGNVRRDRSL